MRQIIDSGTLHIELTFMWIKVLLNNTSLTRLYFQNWFPFMPWQLKSIIGA